MTSSERSILIIANPASNRGKGGRLATAVAEELTQHGLRVEVRYTTGSGDAASFTAEALADSAAGFTCIAACGGDGTVQEVASVLADARLKGRPDCPALGVIPAGRCNDFARALGINRDPVAIAEILGTGQPCPIDLGRANGHYFCTVATMGIDAEVSSYVDSMTLPLKGTAAYLYGAVRVLMSYRAQPVKLEGDFGVLEGPIYMASTANTACYGGAIQVAPGASPTDGLLDVCVVAPLSRLRALRLIPVLMKGRHAAEPEVQLLKTRRLRITTNTPSELWADGERLTTTPAELEVIPGAVEVLLPR